MTWLFSKALCESLPYSQEQGAESSEGTFSDGEPYAQLNAMPTPHKFWRNDKTMDASNLSRFGLTLRLLTESHGEAVLTSFLEAFPVRTSPQQGEGKELAEQDQGSGLSSLESLAKYDPDTCSWKTPQYSLLGGLEEFSETWPRWGTMRNGECWAQQMWALRTKGTESGLWPTPTVCGNYNRKGASKTSGDGLATAVKKWPTPTAHDAKDTGAAPSEGARNTPGLPYQAGGKLNPQWVEWLMGWPIGWTDLKPLETAKFQQWRQEHSLKD